MITQAIKKLSYLIFPKRCDMCGDVIELYKLRCDACINLNHIDGEICLRCGCEKEKCSCRKNDKKPEYKAIAAPYYFEDSAVRAIHRFKFNNYTELSKAMATEMAAVISKRFNDVNFDYITYVPLTKKRFKKRGYNQSCLLAEHISSVLDIELIEALSKIYDTQSQRVISAKERKNNLHGAFDINTSADIVQGKVFLLIDDVKTTGTTLNECAMVLKGYGAEGVYACTFAVTKK